MIWATKRKFINAFKLTAKHFDFDYGDADNLYSRLDSFSDEMPEWFFRGVRNGTIILHHAGANSWVYFKMVSVEEKKIACMGDYIFIDDDLNVHVMTKAAFEDRYEKMGGDVLEKVES